MQKIDASRQKQRYWLARPPAAPAIFQGNSFIRAFRSSGETTLVMAAAGHSATRQPTETRHNFISNISRSEKPPGIATSPAAYPAAITSATAQNPRTQSPVKSLRWNQRNDTESAKNI